MQAEMPVLRGDRSGSQRRYAMQSASSGLTQRILAHNVEVRRSYRLAAQGENEHDAMCGQPVDVASTARLAASLARSTALK
jgi:hypothetical protein